MCVYIYIYIYINTHNDNDHDNDNNNNNDNDDDKKHGWSKHGFSRIPSKHPQLTFLKIIEWLYNWRRLLQESDPNTNLFADIQIQRAAAGVAVPSADRGSASRGLRKPG